MEVLLKHSLCVYWMFSPCKDSVVSEIIIHTV